MQYQGDKETAGSRGVDLGVGRGEVEGARSSSSLCSGCGIHRKEQAQGEPQGRWSHGAGRGLGDTGCWLCHSLKQ